MNDGRINVKLDEAVVQEVVGLIDEIKGKLPFVLKLDAKEKQRLVKPHPGTKQVVDDVVQVQADAGMPIQPDHPMLADLSVFVGLTRISDKLADLLQEVDDTRLLAGSEAWNAGLIHYGMLRQVARAKPEIEAKLDRIQPLITSRSTRSESPSADPPGEPPLG